MLLQVLTRHLKFSGNLRVSSARIFRSNQFVSTNTNSPHRSSERATKNSSVLPIFLNMGGLSSRFEPIKRDGTGVICPLTVLSILFEYVAVR